MFNAAYIIRELDKNTGIFESLLEGLSKEEYMWKPLPEKWCMLEVICHLCDEEREDFRGRLKHVLENNADPLPSIDPQEWVSSRKYQEQNYKLKVSEFVTERSNSIEWLNTLKNPKWDNAYNHPKFGPLSAKLFLSNWLAHDYHHIRQINALKHDYLKEQSGEKLDYAGTW